MSDSNRLRDQFIESDGSLKARQMFLVGLVGTLMAFAEGVADVIRAVLDITVINPLSMMSEYQGDLMAAWLDIPRAAIDGVFGPTITYLSSFGVLAYPIGIAITLAIAYVIAVVIEYV